MTSLLGWLNTGNDENSVTDNYLWEKYGREAKPTTGQVLSDRISESWEDVTDFYTVQKSRVQENPINEERFKGQNFHPNVKWHEGMTLTEGLQLHEAMKRREYAARNWENATTTQQVFGWGATFVGGFADPVNIATSFIPVFGVSGKLATMAAGAKTAASRIGYRAAQGFAEGAVGNLYAEPFTYYQMDVIQHDYGALDTLTNTVLGGFMGSALHTGVGAYGEWRNGRITANKHAEAVQLAANQILNDAPVDVELLIKEGKLSERERMLDVQEEIINKSLQDEGLANKVDELTAKSKPLEGVTAEPVKENIFPPAKEFELGELVGKGSAARYTNYNLNAKDLLYLEAMNNELQQSTRSSITIVDNLNEPGATVYGNKSTSPDWFQSLNRTITENNKSRAKTIKKNQRKTIDKQDSLPPSQTILTKEIAQKVVDKLINKKPLGANEGRIAKDLLNIARSYREENTRQMLDFRASREYERKFIADEKARLNEEAKQFIEQNKNGYIDPEDLEMMKVIDEADAMGELSDNPSRIDKEIEELDKYLDELEQQGYLSKEEIAERSVIASEGKNFIEYSKAYKAAATCMIRNFSNGL